MEHLGIDVNTTLITSGRSHVAWGRSKFSKHTQQRFMTSVNVKSECTSMGHSRSVIKPRLTWRKWRSWSHPKNRNGPNMVHEHKVFSNFFGEVFFAQIPGVQDVSLFFWGGAKYRNRWVPDTPEFEEIWADFKAYSIICPPFSGKVVETWTWPIRNQLCWRRSMNLHNSLIGCLS